MKFALADEIIDDLRRVQLAVADQGATVSYLAGLQRLRGFIDALEVEAARRLHELTHAAPTELAKATQRHARAADRIYERSATLTAVPSLVAPLGSGDLQAAHVDTVSKSFERSMRNTRMRSRQHCRTSSRRQPRRGRHLMTLPAR